MQVAEPTDADAEAVVDLWRRCGLTRPWNNAFDDFALARHGAASTVLVGHEDGAVIASIMVGFDGHRGWVYYLAVDPDRQRLGHGRTMMSPAEQWLARLGAPKLHLMLRETNTAALGFYERLGFLREPVITLSKRLAREA